MNFRHTTRNFRADLYDIQRLRRAPTGNRYWHVLRLDRDSLDLDGLLFVGWRGFRGGFSQQDKREQGRDPKGQGHCPHGNRKYYGAAHVQNTSPIIQARYYNEMPELPQTPWQQLCQCCGIS